MKRNLILLAAAGCLALTSCNDNDDDNNNNVSADLTGSYQLSAVTAPSAQDYDGDGDSSSNLALEGNCYHSSWISFHDDGTYEEESNSSVMGSTGLSLDCDSNVSSGTYTQTGNTITTNKTAGSGNATATYSFNSTSHTLTRTDSNASYRALNASTQLWANLTGSLSYTFTKYTDNDDDGGATLDDTDNNANTTVNAALVGDFDLTSYLVATAQDLDHNGNSSTNLVGESNCYGSSNITLNADGTYEETLSYATVGDLGVNLECASTVHYGRWTRDGNTVTMTDLSTAVHTTNEFALNATTHTLSRADASADYPVFNSVTSLFESFSGSVSYTYTRS